MVLHSFCATSKRLLCRAGGASGLTSSGQATSESISCVHCDTSSLMAGNDQQEAVVPGPVRGFPQTIQSKTRGKCRCQAIGTPACALCEVDWTVTKSLSRRRSRREASAQNGSQCSSRTFSEVLDSLSSQMGGECFRDSPTTALDRPAQWPRQQPPSPPRLTRQGSLAYQAPAFRRC